MARAVGARMEGDDYQALVFWKYAIKLIHDGSEIEKIEFENSAVKSFDDIVIHYMDQQRFRDGYILNDYIQVKFHMTGNDVFTFENLVKPAFINSTRNSFLSNVKNAMEQLGDKFYESRFIIYSPIAISPKDRLYQYVSNVDGTIRLDELFDGTTDRSKSGKIRKMLRSALNITEDTLQKIIGQVVIMALREPKDALIDSLNSKFESMGMKQIVGETGLNPYIDITRTWIEHGMTEFTKDSLIAECRRGKLLICYDGTNTDEYFYTYRAMIRENRSKVRTLLDKSSEVELVGPNGIYVDTHVLVNGERVLLDSIDKLVVYGRHFIVSAIGGYGKSMLLRRLLIDSNSLDKYVPVFIELRNVPVTRNDGFLMKAIQKTISDNHLDISLDEIDLALKRGKMLLLLDGLDEVKRENLVYFENEIIEMSNKYPNSLIVVSTRPYSVSLHLNDSFITMEICPLTVGEAKFFIRRIVHNDILADSFCAELESGIYESHKDFADNPLLLTLMYMVYRRNIGIPDKMSDFYYAAFECLFKDHDNGKGDFQREYKTQMLGDIEFQNLLAFVCVQSYFSEDYDFCDDYLVSVVAQGIEYFKLQSKISRPDYFISDLKDFIHILIQEGDEYRFIHRSFQTYFAALFIMKNIPDNKQKLMFRKMISGDRFEEFFEFFDFLGGLEGRRCIDNIFRDEFVSICREEGTNKRYNILKLLFKKIGVEIVGKGNTGSENYINISDDEDFNYYMAYEKQENTYLDHLVRLFCYLCPIRYPLNESEEKEFCKLMVECKLDYYPPRLLLMPLARILDYPTDIRDKVLQYHYRFYGIQDIVEYTNDVLEKEEHDNEQYYNFRYYLAGII